MSYNAPVKIIAARKFRLASLLGLLLAGSLAACQRGEGPVAADAVTGPVPAELRDGEARFAMHCARCHGVGAAGTDHGPTFLSQIYAPNHHADAAFQLAVRNGVRAHHWRFGDMPPLPQVQPQELDRIVAYVRWLQRANRIF